MDTSTKKTLKKGLGMQNKEVTVTDLEHNGVDDTSIFWKGTLGATPFAGPFLAEMVGKLIPDQRMDRISAFLKILDKKLQNVEESLEVLESKMKEETFLNAFEEASWQSTRSSSIERKEYLASMLINSLTDDKLDEIQKSIFLNIINELNDVEILILYNHTMKARYDKNFRKNNESILTEPIAFMGASQDEIDKSTLHNTYKEKLVRLNLLSKKFPKPKKGELPEFDDKTGMIKSNGYEITSLGKLFLKHIDLLEKDEM